MMISLITQITGPGVQDHTTKKSVAMMDTGGEDTSGQGNHVQRLATHVTTYFFFGQMKLIHCKKNVQALIGVNSRAGDSGNHDTCRLNTVKITSH